MSEVPSAGDFVKFFLEYKRLSSVKRTGKVGVAYGSVIEFEKNRYSIDIIGPARLRKRYFNEKNEKAIVRVDRNSILEIVPPSMIDRILGLQKQML